MDLDGNTLTHTFTLRVMKYTQNGYSITVVGSGVSQGPSQYFLFKVSDSQQINNRYYCIPAEADETYFKEADDSGSSTVDVNCAIYQELVDSMTPFNVEYLPTNEFDFNMGNQEEGTIFIDGIDSNLDQISDR